MVRVDEAFLAYLESGGMSVDLHVAVGAHYSTIATAKVCLVNVLVS